MAPHPVLARAPGSVVKTGRRWCDRGQRDKALASARKKAKRDGLQNLPF